MKTQTTVRWVDGYNKDWKFTGLIKYLKYSHGTYLQFQIEWSKKTTFGTNYGMKWVDEEDLMISVREIPEEVIVSCEI